MKKRHYLILAYLCAAATGVILWVGNALAAAMLMASGFIYVLETHSDD